MAARAVLFALDTKDVDRLLACRGDDEVMEVVEEVEERWEEDHVCELDKSWDALHRCLTDGQLSFENGDFPLSHAILGGAPLLDGEDYIVSYVTADEVRAVAAALEPLDREWIGERFASLAFDDYQGPGDADDVAYTQAFLPDLQTFYRTAAREGRAVVFTVDQ
ncbi:YfbM family protein [Streptomyces sp. NPDC001941]|uniref:YfbM family protein n=1 Tax=Streptomyces sp. NPDC001941 TaxID=3154659 RepID=UPI00332686AF